MRLVVFTDPASGEIRALTPPAGMTAEEAQHGRPAIEPVPAADDGTPGVAGTEGLAPAIPAGVASFIVDSETLPLDAPLGAWRLDGAGKVTIDAAAAADIALAGRSCLNLQMRRALRKLGLIDAVNAYVKAQPDDVQDSWEYGVTIPASDAMVIAACAALGVDRKALFDLADSL